MIILDTNVISELQKSDANAKVLQYLATLDHAEVFISAISVHEIWLGCLLLPEGARKNKLCKATQIMFSQYFEGHVLSFDATSALTCAEITAISRRKGFNYGLADLQIAAIAMRYGFQVATRNVQDFQHDGLVVINPWAD
jgi:toxin FitB